MSELVLWHSVEDKKENKIIQLESTNQFNLMYEVLKIRVS